MQDVKREFQFAGNDVVWGENMTHMPTHNSFLQEKAKPAVTDGQRCFVMNASLQTQ